ncbi:hypothetical protein [Campylobacter concisus]|uniref:hypothetical protein n=1 Tax=Campylobacter concisus TaxID=199 RepID=UPI000CD80498|nr:hypothetical protein [Campylobacter concisus]
MIKLLLNLSSFSWAILLYALDKKIFEINSVSFWLFVLNFIGINLLPIIVFMRCKIYSSGKQEISKIYPAYSEYVPAFFAVCVVAFSLKHYSEYEFAYLIIIICILFWLFYMNNVGYLNPALFLLGYRIYKVESNRTEFILIMSRKREYKKIKILEFKELISLDEHTYLYK